jgi:hypothetical protein
MTPSSRELEQIARSQTRQQILLIILCIFVAALAVATWRSGSAMREANQIQRQLLAQESDAPPKGQKKRRAGARPANKVSSESRRSPDSRRGQDETSSRQALADSKTRADLTNTHALLVRHGRQ